VPDPPWFAKLTIPTIPNVSAITADGTTIDLPYIRYALIDNELMLLGTAGWGQDVYGDYLRALPAPVLPFEDRDNEALKDLYTECYTLC
jgi:hypothetical protein